MLKIIKKAIKAVYYQIRFTATAIHLTRRKVIFGDKPLFMHGTPLIRTRGKIEIGKNFRISSYQFKPELFCGKNGKLKIGNNVYINRGVSICANKNIEIGDDCLIGDLVSITDSNWHEVSPDKNIKERSITIGKNVWIGKNVIILPGVTIGNHSVISAGSIITNDVPEKSIIYQEKINKIVSFSCDDDYIRK